MFKKAYSLGLHSDLDCKKCPKEIFQTSFLEQGHLIVWHLLLLMDVIWVIKSSSSLFGTKLAKIQQENKPMMIFRFCPFYGQKVSQSSNVDKNGLKSIHFVNSVCTSTLFSKTDS